MQKIGLFLSSLLLFIFSYGIKAQNDSIPKNAVFFTLDNLNFVKNNEYNNNIADGYTLLGSQLHPKISFYPHSKIKLELGLFGLTYAGTGNYHKVSPTFSIRYTNQNTVFIMGTLQNENSHNLIAPLMSFESLLDERRVENGLQFLLNTNELSLDTWLNWEKFIFKQDDNSEEFVLGISADYKALKSEKWEIFLPLQNLLYHRGGQINTDLLNNKRTFTMWHAAAGLRIIHNFKPQQKLGFSSYFLHFRSNATPAEYRFKRGAAWLTNMSYHYKNWIFGLGYWSGDHFVSPRGDDMFQSVSVRVDSHYEDDIVEEIFLWHTEPKRDLFLGKISYEKNLLQNLKIGVKINAFYQNYSSDPTPIDTEHFVKQELDFSAGLYLTYKGSFKLDR